MLEKIGMFFRFLIWPIYMIGVYRHNRRARREWVAVYGKNPSVVKTRNEDIPPNTSFAELRGLPDYGPNQVPRFIRYKGDQA